MARPRNPKRDEALQIWLESKGQMLLKEIAQQLELSDSQIRKWKNQDGWDDLLNGNVTKPNGNVTNEKQPKKKVVESEEVLSDEEEGDDGLTDKQRLFCIYYVRSLNATSAYKKAYKCAYSTAMVEGSKHLRKPKIAEKIAELKQERLEQENLSKDDILQKYKAIAFADITDFIDFTQVESEATETEVEYNPDGSKKSEKTEVVPYTYTKFAMHHSEEIDGTLITELSKGKDGMFKMKLADKMAALAFLAKYTDVLNERELKQLQVEKLRIESEVVRKANEKQSTVINVVDSWRDDDDD